MWRVHDCAPNEPKYYRVVEMHCKGTCNGKLQGEYYFRLENSAMIKISWDEDTCIHSGDCCSLLPKVFREEDDKIVIDASQAAEDAIRDAVGRCPSGALKVEG